MNKKNTIFLISGPSGVGKDSVIKKLNESNANIKNIITITTRKIRENENCHTFPLNLAVILSWV